MSEIACCTGCHSTWSERMADWGKSNTEHVWVPSRVGRRGSNHGGRGKLQIQIQTSAVTARACGRRHLWWAIPALYASVDVLVRVLAVLARGIVTAQGACHNKNTQYKSPRFNTALPKLVAAFNSSREEETVIKPGAAATWYMRPHHKQRLQPFQSGSPA